MDGKRLLPKITKNLWQFRIPAQAREVWLASDSFMPFFVEDALADRRALGVRVLGVHINGEAANLADAVFAEGFHDCEDGGVRWSNGRARLDLSRWSAPSGEIKLALRFDAAPHVVWTAPRAERRLAG